MEAACFYDILISTKLQRLTPQKLVISVTFGCNIFNDYKHIMVSTTVTKAPINMAQLF
jgi:hypothetical protein